MEIMRTVRRTTFRGTHSISFGSSPVALAWDPRRRRRNGTSRGREHFNLESRISQKKFCVCGKSYWPKQAWIHKACASNALSGSASNNACDTAEDVPMVVREQGAAVRASGPAGSGGVVAGAKQRWSRDAYNAYQREYMRRKRAGFIGIAYG